MSDHNENIEQEDVGMAMKKPFNPNNIKVRLQAIPIYAMAERIHHNEINLQTAFQRKEGLWKDKQQSRLIESILIRFPLPVFYFEGSDPDKWLVIDGLQRLTSLKRFMVTKELKLTDLEFLKQLEGKGWDDLDRPQQRQINETILQCHIIEEGDDDAIFNIFKRINTGGLSLSDQEIRHAMHQDVADYLKNLAESQEFIKATRGKVSPERMLDRDFVNRFLAFYLFNQETDYTYDDDLDSFMNRTLDKVATLSQSERQDLELRFKAAMDTARSIFGDSAFCKKKDYKRINKALFEVIAVSFAKLSDNQRDELVRKKTAFRTLFFNSVNVRFADSLTSNTGGKSNIALRHREFNNLVNSTLNS
ncbi:DUF262 domain-containing protein [Aequorivita xiaoshiensis]|uniref:DUF262 domain-containing protein n=1 Tax=Aequorivita xiaoshiensis TaxID=2874476 RepID=A0A9X1R499_9FLAO|nr:DUF262 domain-containing protein [Aequorivita xiaoshiensis]MCG2431627.1 DUF262 domain-containing protein [Aequorivita xiaoshiensis]